jgi:sugar (pentulose or hexulose) kinase
MTLLALDIGTTFIKGAVLDLDQLQLSHIQRQPAPKPVSNLPALFYEIDPQSLVAAVRTLLINLLAVAPDCEGIVICTQMHGLVLCTARGEARSNAITWQDQRSLTPHPGGDGTHLARLLATISAEELQQTGHEVQPSRPLSYLYWMAVNGKLPQEHLIPASLADFVIANLAGSTPTIEPTNAGAHGAMNLATMQWQEPILARLGLDHLRWPEIRPFGHPIAELKITGKSLPCYAPIGDHQCAVVGALLAPDELSLNISTGSQVSLITPQLTLGNYQTRPFFDGHFLNTITGIPAGRALNHLVNLLTELAELQGKPLDDPWFTITQAVATLAGRGKSSDLTVNLAFFDSIGGNSGSIANIREDNLTVGHLFHAAFQSMARNYYQSALNLAANQPWRQLVFSGGLAQKIEVLQTLIQQQFNRPTRLCPSAEDTMLGLLALGLVATARKPTVAAAIDHLVENSEIIRVI